MKVRAKVVAIRGKPGKMYAVTRPLEGEVNIGEGETITFTLWTAWAGGENNPPEEEQIVILEEIKEYSKGWRASIASSSTLKDAEEPEVKGAGK